jgi:aspartyl-tRNA(Asn)/glutamyl-tRNA(Gln) amidotransferase subunit A
MTDHENVGEEIVFLSAVELGGLYRARELSPTEVVDATLAHIEAVNPTLNAYVTITAEIARKQALIAEQALAAGEGAERPLLGVPISLKDLTPTKGIRTTNGSLLTKDWVPDADPVLVQRIYASGAVLLGKTNVPEHGWKGDTTNRIVGSSHNPWRPGLTTGGSSGGAAAAVAAGMGPIAQGSDGAGSIRIPSSICGVFGLKPTYGTVPAGEPSMERVSQVGPIARTVHDAALLLGVIAGRDARDPDSWAPHGADYIDDLDDGVRGVRVAWSPDLGYATVDPEIAGMVAEAVTVFTEFGCEVEEVGPPFEDPCGQFEIMSATAEAAEYGTREQLGKVRDLLDQGRLRHIEAGWTFSGVDVAVANARRAELYVRMRELMETYDLLVTPTLPVKPFPAGRNYPPHLPGSLTDALCWPRFTYPFNLTGQPAASVPCGFTSDGLPVGLHVVGRWREDSMVLRAARAFELARPWAAHRPAVADRSVPFRLPAD